MELFFSVNLLRFEVTIFPAVEKNSLEDATNSMIFLIFF
jgi:hypothetical protein